MKLSVRKNKWGNWEVVFSGEDYQTKERIYANVFCSFAKGIEPFSDYQVCEVHDGDWWIFPYKKKDGTTTIRFYIKAWYPVENAFKKEANPEPINVGNKLEIDSDDLPF